MDNNKHPINKQGNVFIPIGIAVLVIIFAIIFLIYCQVNIIVENLRQDLFYASNNAILSFNTQDLAYNKYTIDRNHAKDIIENILNKNYTGNNGSITKIKVTDLKIIEEQEKVNFKIQVDVTFKSVINIAGENEHSFKMNEDITISLLDYLQGE